MVGVFNLYTSAFERSNKSLKQIFKNKKITGILSILPEQEILFEDEVQNYNFPASQTMRLKNIMGYQKHRIIKDASAPSDLCIYGIEYLENKGLLKVGDVDAIVVITQTPDYIMPPTSNVIQGRVGFRKDILCIDINQACAGFLVGLMQSFMLLGLNEINKVALINVDTFSKKVSKKDRNSYPLAGDAASVTIIENDLSANDIYFNLYMDGTRCDALIVPSGGFKTISTPETMKMIAEDDGNMRALDHLTMNGTAVLNYVMSEVPPMIDELFEFANCDREDIDWFFFHQPNKFMLEKLATKIAIPYEKMPMNIVTEFGNSSGVTIPLNITHNLGNRLLSNRFQCCLAGFGAGLTKSSMLIHLSNFEFCEKIVSNF